MAADEFEGVGQLWGSVTEMEFVLDNGGFVALLLGGDRHAGFGGFLRGVGVLAVARGGGVVPLSFCFFVFNARRAGENTGYVRNVVGAHHDVHTIALLVGGIRAGEHTLTKAGDVGDAHPGGTFDAGQGVSRPTVVERNFGEHEAARGFTEITLERLLGQQAAQHLVGGPAHRSDRGNTHALEEFGAVRVIHTRHNVLHLEHFACHTGGNNIRVIARRDGGKSVRFGNAGTLEGVLIKTDTGHQTALKALTQRLESTFVLVNDGDRMPRSFQSARQHDAHASGTHNDEVRHTSLRVLMFYGDKALPPTSTSVMGG